MAISANELRILFDNVMEVVEDDAASLTAFHSLFKYIGFDVMEFIGKLKEKQPQQDQFAKDITKMIVLFVTRGNSVTSMKRKMGKEGIRMLEDLVTTYHIKPKVGDSSDPNVVTLARVATCFTHITATILTKVQATLPYNVQMDHPTCPKALSLSSIFSILPSYSITGLTSDQVAAFKERLSCLIKAALLCQYKQYRVINTKNRDRARSEIEIGSQVNTYGAISYRSNVYTAHDRSKHSKAIGLIKHQTSTEITIFEWAVIMASELDTIFDAAIEVNYF